MPRKQPPAETIGGRIRALRLAAGLTVTAAAAASGIHRTVWTGLESGRRSPTWETLARLAPVLGASLGDFDLSEKKE